MLIYHTHSNACSIGGGEYKSKAKRVKSVNPPKVSGAGSRRRSKSLGNRKLSKKNKKFLEGLGLKVKQSIENC